MFSTDVDGVEKFGEFGLWDNLIGKGRVTITKMFYNLDLLESRELWAPRSRVE
jgi:hypothetical protein